MFLKYIICAMLAAVSLPVEDGRGWFPVEKVQRAAPGAEEEDPSIWVLFSKNLGNEKILVRFPVDPVYRYSENGSLEIFAEKEGETFLLSVQEAGPVGPPISDLHYQSEGKWIHEHFVQTETHFYHFKTLGDQAKSPGHEAFISSFLIEKNG